MPEEKVEHFGEEIPWRGPPRPREHDPEARTEVDELQAALTEDIRVVCLPLGGTQFSKTSERVFRDAADFWAERKIPFRCFYSFQ